jgi:pseudomonalisin
VPTGDVMGAGKPRRRARWGSAAAAAVTVAGTAVLGVAAAGTAQAAPEGTGWAPTATHGLQLASASELAAAPSSTPLRLTLGLAPRDRAGLDALIRRQATPGSADYGRYLTPAQFTAQFAATQATATAVANYLTSQGMTGVTVAPNRLQVTADATVAQAQQAFHTTIAQFRQGGRTVLANTTDALVPANLAGAVTGVLGLSSLGFSTAPTPSVPNLNGFYHKQLGTVYHVGSTTPGTGMTLAVIAEGNLTQTVKDLRTAESKQGLRQVPVSLVHTGPASSDTSGADEWDLDTQSSTGVAPNAKALKIYIATSLTNSDLARAINRFASDGTAQAGSASLGECDVLPFLDGSMVVDDMALAEAASQGQTFFASTGDTGSACAVLPTNGVPLSGLPDTEYPASSPYAVGVGGTTLLASSTGVYQSEVAWNAGGGGASPVENSGPWQSAVVPTAAADVRGVPDVAFDADPNTGALIYVNGAPEQIGGTSLSSPLAMGLWTRLQASHGGHLGFASPKLYALYPSAPLTAPTGTAFHDVVIGSNGAYPATPGWDYTTGLGSWDVAALSAALH